MNYMMVLTLFKIKINKKNICLVSFLKKWKNSVFIGENINSQKYFQILHKSLTKQMSLYQIDIIMR